MHDKEIKQWDKRLTDQAKSAWENYKHLYIDLSTARADQSYLLTGEFLYVEDSSGEDAKAKIKLNRTSNDALDIEKFVKIETIFTQVFITNEALQGEWLDIIFGINFKYYKEIPYIQPADPQRFQAYPCVIFTKATPGAATGPWNECHRVLLRAHTENVDTVWIDFGPPAAVGTCYELTPGDAISVPLMNTNLVRGWFVAGGDKVTIVYEVEI